MKFSTTYEGKTYSGDLREDESVAVQPLGVLGVELHELVEKDVGNRRHTPRTTLVKPSPMLSTLLCLFLFFFFFFFFFFLFHLHGRARVARVGVEGGIDLLMSLCQYMVTCHFVSCC